MRKWYRVITAKPRCHGLLQWGDDSRSCRQRAKGRDGSLLAYSKVLSTAMKCAFDIFDQLSLVLLVLAMLCKELAALQCDKLTYCCLESK